MNAAACCDPLEKVRLRYESLSFAQRHQKIRVEPSAGFSAQIGLAESECRERPDRDRGSSHPFDAEATTDYNKPRGSSASHLSIPTSMLANNPDTNLCRLCVVLLGFAAIDCHPPAGSAPDPDFHSSPQAPSLQQSPPLNERRPRTDGSTGGNGSQAGDAHHIAHAGADGEMHGAVESENGKEPDRTAKCQANSDCRIVLVPTCAQIKNCTASCRGVGTPFALPVDAPDPPRPDCPGHRPPCSPVCGDGCIPTVHCVEQRCTVRRCTDSSNPEPLPSEAE